MNKLMPIVALMALAHAAGAVEVTTTPGQLSTMVEDRNVTELTISGSMDARDFHFIAGELGKLTRLDLSAVTIVAYSDAQQPLTAAVYDFEAGTLPQSMLMGMRLEHLILPDSLRAIGMAALAGCDRLTELVIPSTVTRIDDYALSGARLTQITVPASVTTMGQGVFAHCFDMSAATLLCPEVGDYAFLGNERLQSVTLGEQVRHIGREAFHGTGLVTFDATAAVALDSVGDWFAASTPLTTVSLPPSMTAMGQGAFFGTTTLTAATLPAGITDVPDFAFAGGSRMLADTLLREGVETIGDYAFYNWDNTRYFFIPSTVKRIGTRAMAGMTSLEELDVDATVVPALGDSVWAGVDQPTANLLVVDNDAAALYAEAEQWREFNIPLGYIKGDVNGDGVVDVTDINLIINYMLGNVADGFIFAAGDINDDGVIDVTDVNEVINIVLGGVGRAPRRNARGQRAATHLITDDMLYVDALSVKPGETYTLDVMLANSRDYNAMQFDITLPDGLEMAGTAQGTGRSADHIHATRTLGNTTRVVSVSMQALNFANNDDAIVRLQVKATGEVGPDATIDIYNVLLAQGGQGYYAPSTSATVGNTTGIANLTADTSRAYAAGSTLIVETPEATTVQVVSLSGMVRTIDVPAGHSEWNDIAPGIYVVRLNAKSYKLQLQ